ncbi:TMEM175 family protein [Mucilaginibacter lappiensis]|uniref:Putative membrane protein n=1 Tax=Mucilaginibacter lappiensis TaxID=354630 RepID=A0A841JB35_9SPHI|nr:TMEM175 family protein [Mucilaginibacter lappiensis]MBB6126796.1 putative membrane protein [Mucilaginibacter lappiensis]
MAFGKSRVEAFSDGVIAIIITIMVLEMKVPHGDSFASLKPLMPVLLSYVLSFTYVGIYWNNHHHMFHIVKSVNGAVLWANLHLLFWLSLIPFVTGWVGENHFTQLPVACYGFILAMNGLAYTILEKTLIRHNGKNSVIANVLGRDWKAKSSVIIYAVAIGLSWLSPVISFVLYGVVAALWFIPDKRIENKLTREASESKE